MNVGTKCSIEDHTGFQPRSFAKLSVQRVNTKTARAVHGLVSQWLTPTGSQQDKAAAVVGVGDEMCEQIPT